MACTAPDTTGVRMIGHGGSGAGSDLPMNSREALLGGLQQGFDGIEMDLQLTADGILVAYHDDELSGVAPCSGLVNSRTWTELRQCSQFSRPLVRVDSLLFEAQAQYPSAEFTLDVKLFAAGDWWPYMEAFSDAIIALDQGLNAPLLIECQTTDFLKLMRRKAPDASLFYYATDPENGILEAKDLGCTGITMTNGNITAAQMEQAHAEGLSVTLFGVDGNWGLRRAVAKKPDRIQSDLAVHK
ncbi:MAG TPA: glycerophosphodiester phosphodiesterase family protein [Flavobacteriales bacterium]|nr:glycerophosphodiester phosphodiesterase family protein [Flavobacteriales bacterium]